MVKIYDEQLSGHGFKLVSQTWICVTPGRSFYITNMP